MYKKRTVIRRAFLLRTNPLLIVLCFLAAWLATGPFIDSTALRFVLSVPGLLLLLRAAQRWTNSRRLQFSREQFKWFLELLLARLSAGATLERSLSDTLPGLSQLLGHKSELIRGLQQLDQQLTARQPLESLLPQFSRHLLCPESSVFFHVLPELRKTGGQLVQYVRQHVQMVTEQLSLQQDLNAETTQRQTEALILTLMPFALAALIRQSSDQLTLESLGQPAGVIGRIFAFALAMLAAFLTISSLGFIQNKKHGAQTVCKAGSDRPMALQGRICSLFHRLYRDLLPEAYGARLLQILLEQATAENIPDQQIFMGFFNQKMLYLLISFLPGLLILLVFPSGWYGLFLLPILILILHDQKVFALRRQKMTDYRLEYPVFLNLANALLQAGLSLHKTLHICLDSLQTDQGDPKSQTSSQIKELGSIRRQMLTGCPVDQIIEQLAATCPLPEAQAALLLMLRYDRSGGFETLQLLSMQSSACWSLYRSTMRKQMEQQSLRLLLPMTLDLLAVLLTALLPAVLSLSTF